VYGAGVASNDLDEIVSSRLRTAQQRYTRGRRRIIAALREGTGPMTIPQILASDQHLAQSSTYRNLAILEEVGVVSRIVTRDDFARYELAEDITEHHHHLICSSCGEVADFSLQPGIEAELERALAKVARQSSFEIDGHRLDLVGLCGACT
jgi:Fur family transcriptional regulator, ferric uptake regulator